MIGPEFAGLLVALVVVLLIIRALHEDLAQRIANEVAAVLERRDQALRGDDDHG